MSSLLHLRYRNFTKPLCYRLVIWLLLQESTYDETVCNLKYYTTCFNKKYILSEKEAQSDLVQCEEKCLDVCERTTYLTPKGSEYSYTAEGSIYKQENYAIIQLVVANFDYPIFEETFKWTFSSFFGTIGGALGLWLGISALGSTIYATTGVKFLIQLWKGKPSGKRLGKPVLKLGGKSDAQRDAFKRSRLSNWKRYVSISIYFGDVYRKKLIEACDNGE